MRTSLILIISILFLYGCTGRKIRGPELLMAADHGGPGATYLCFYQDSTVVFMPGIFSTEQEGTYTMRDSVLITNGIASGGYFQSNYFLLTNRHPRNPNWQGKLLVQIDSSGRIIDNGRTLPVDRDWRDSVSHTDSVQKGLLRMPNAPKSK